MNIKEEIQKILDNLNHNYDTSEFHIYETIFKLEQTLRHYKDWLECQS